MKKGQSMKYKRKLLGAEEVERLVREVEDFAEREGRMPSGKAPDEAERALRSRYDYLTRPSKSHLLSDGQRARLESARTLYRRKAAELDLDEEARFAVRYADERGEMPHQSDSDPRVRRCAFALSYSDNINRLSPSLRAELVEARKVCGVYAYEDTLELVDDYVSFVELEGREPDPRSPALGERRLVHALRRRKGEMDDEQLRRVCGARDSVCRRGQTSFSEKLLAEGIRSAMTSGDFIGCNVTLEGRETDILVSRADGGRVCVQYDGAIHRGALSAERDHSADATMAALGMAVVRAREPGCEPYAETPEAVPVMLAAPLLERDDAGLASEVLRVAAAAGLDVDVSGVDWGEVRRRAAWESRAEAGNAEGAAEYLYRCLTEEKGRPSAEMKRVKDRMAMRFSRGAIGEPAARALALVEAGLDPTILTSSRFGAFLGRMRGGDGGMPDLAGLRAGRAAASDAPRVEPRVASAAAEWLYDSLLDERRVPSGRAPGFEGVLRDSHGRGAIPAAVLRALVVIESEMGGRDGSTPIFG